jgi:hypothetical protein
MKLWRQNGPQNTVFPKIILTPSLMYRRRQLHVLVLYSNTTTQWYWYNIRTNLIFYLWIQGQCQYLEFDQLQLMLHSTCTESRQHIDSIPLRIVSVHQCFDDNPLYVMMMSGINNKMRMQFFLGNSSCESRYRLLGCGIPVDCTCSSVSDPWLNLESFTLYRSSCAHRPNTCSAPIDIFQQPENHPSTSLDA